MEKYDINEFSFFIDYKQSILNNLDLFKTLQNESYTFKMWEINKNILIIEENLNNKLHKLISLNSYLNLANESIIAKEYNYDKSYYTSIEYFIDQYTKILEFCICARIEIEYEILKIKSKSAGYRISVSSIDNTLQKFENYKDLLSKKGINYYNF